MSELGLIYAECKRLHETNPHRLDRETDLILQGLNLQGHQDAFRTAIKDFLATYTIGFYLPPWKDVSASPEISDIFLRNKLEFFEMGKKKLEHIRQLVTQLFGYIAEHVPHGEPTFGFVPLCDLAPVQEIFGNIVREMTCDVCRRNYFFDTIFNSLLLSHEIKLNSSDHGMFVATRFGGTPFADLLRTPVPLSVPLKKRFDHTHVLGRPGAGKTTLLEQFILSDLSRSDPPSLVIVDSQSDLIRNLAHADIWKKDPILIDPRDIQNPVALNIFDPGPRYAMQDEAAREQFTNGVMDTFDYLFAGVFGADLTTKQSTFFQFVVRLMFALPAVRKRNATLVDLVNFMAEPSEYRDVIDTLPDFQRTFFIRDVLPKEAKTFLQTREQIRYRLNAILGTPTLNRMLTAPTTKLDIYSELNAGSVILVDTAADFLGNSCKDFGKFFISLVLRAILERAAIPEHSRKPTFILIDECWQYFDSNISDLLIQARKYQCGLVLSHQLLSQASGPLRSALIGATSLKFAAPSAEDARALAAEMRLDPNHNVPPLSFMTYIHGITPRAVQLSVTPGQVTSRQKRADYHQFLERNRARVSYAPLSPAPRQRHEDMSDEY